ncbi:MAG: hypothetical protein SO206_06615, partial [Bacilli bacterium]|nr:hypothetical protein [Bacilli bacterium]
KLRIWMPCLKYLYLVFPCNEFNGSKIANGLLNEYNRSRTLSFNEKGGLLTIISHSSGSYSKKSCPSCSELLTTLNPSSFNL